MTCWRCRCCLRIDVKSILIKNRCVSINMNRENINMSHIGFVSYITNLTNNKYWFYSSIEEVRFNFNFKYFKKKKKNTNLNYKLKFITSCNQGRNLSFNVPCSRVSYLLDSKDSMNLKKKSSIRARSLGLIAGFSLLKYVSHKFTFTINHPMHRSFPI